MMNTNTEQKYIFITPYLTEVNRIKTQCSDRKFASPEKSYDNEFSKLNDLHRLLKEGKCIASTHALFSYYTEETKQILREQGYVLVLDEVMNVFQPVYLSNKDVDILFKSGAVTINDKQQCVWEDEEYTEGVFSEIKGKAKSNNLLKYGDEMYFWSIPPDVFECFKDAYLLTYMFEYQMQKYFFDVYGIQYELIGVKSTGKHYEFCGLDEMDRRIDLRAKIHILESDKLNAIGNGRGNLSATWYNNIFQNLNTGKMLELKNNIYNVFRNVFKCEANEVMWSTFKPYKSALKGKGYTNGFVSYNMRATNDFSNRKYMAFCLNVYMQTWAKNYLKEHGAQNISEDMYAISTLIQWVFRSAIRRGEEVWLYLPSKRMRTLFTVWLANLADGRDLEEIKFDLDGCQFGHRRTKKDIHDFQKKLRQEKGANK